MWASIPSRWRPLLFTGRKNGSCGQVNRNITLSYQKLPALSLLNSPVVVTGSFRLVSRVPGTDSPISFNVKFSSLPLNIYSLLSSFKLNPGLNRTLYHPVPQIRPFYGLAHCQKWYFYSFLFYFYFLSYSTGIEALRDEAICFVHFYVPYI